MSANEQFLSLFPFFSPLLPVLEYCRYEKGSYMIRESDQIDMLFFFLTGNAWVLRNLGNGKAHLYQVAGLGDVMGDVEYFLSEDAACSVQCTSEVTVARVPFSEFLRIADMHTGLDRELAVFLAGKLRNGSYAASRNTGFPLNMRLAYYVCSTGFEHIPYARMEEISELLGTSRRHLRRVISEFERAGVIRRVSDGVEVTDRDVLIALSADLDS